MIDPVIVITASLEAAVYAHIKWVGKHYMTDPVIVITVPMEAAVYAHIKWVGKALYDRPSDCHHCPNGSCCVCTHQMGR